MKIGEIYTINNKEYTILNIYGLYAKVLYTEHHKNVQGLECIFYLLKGRKK